MDFFWLPGLPEQRKVSRAPMDANDEMCASRLLASFFFRHRFSTYPDRFTLLLALDDNPAPRNALEAAGLSSGRSKL